ncbi:hypothetical protein EV183_000020 [Coemansia sp. RSA 2336]|nr:hypothetical protein EV183_000642 [Coemansia sp. RSA 2336]KAJ2456464.1 hypothetical protein EV183_000020 [Coemansia sp. RSA 2336]
MFYPRHTHHYRGRFKGKLLVAGVALWLTSTIIAGVRRSTGWTHNSFGLPALAISSDEEMAWQQLQASKDQAPSRNYAEFQRLEQHYLESAPSEQARKQREQRLVEQHGKRMVARHCSSGGFVKWYLGIGERTFDWIARKISSSPRFHMEDPATPYVDLTNGSRRYFHRPCYIGTSSANRDI